MIGFVLGLDVVPRDRSWSPSRRRDVADRRTGTRGAPLAARRRSASCPAPRRVVDQYARGTRRSPKVADPRPRKRDLIKNAFNQLLDLTDPTGITTFAYDLNGNQTTKSEPGGDITSFTWDARDRLAQIDLPGGVVNRFGYDTQNLRVFMDDASGTRRNLLDGVGEVAEHDDVSGERIARYEADPTRADTLLAQTTADGKHQVVTDFLGSVHELVDEAARTRSEYSFDVYGRRAASLEEVSTRWGYAGRPHEPGSRLVYMRARYLDPATGTWLSPDPMREPRALGAYRYAENRPTVLRDPSGEWPFIWDTSCTDTPPFSTWLLSANLEAVQASRYIEGRGLTIRFVDTQAGLMGVGHSIVFGENLLYQEGAEVECVCGPIAGGELHGETKNGTIQISQDALYDPARQPPYIGFASILLHEWTHYSTWFQAETSWPGRLGYFPPSGSGFNAANARFSTDARTDVTWPVPLPAGGQGGIDEVVAQIAEQAAFGGPGRPPFIGYRWLDVE